MAGRSSVRVQTVGDWLGFGFVAAPKWQRPGRWRHGATEFVSFLVNDSHHQTQLIDCTLPNKKKRKHVRNVSKTFHSFRFKVGGCCYWRLVFSCCSWIKARFSSVTTTLLLNSIRWIYALENIARPATEDLSRTRLVHHESGEKNKLTRSAETMHSHSVCNRLEPSAASHSKMLMSEL